MGALMINLGLFLMVCGAVVYSVTWISVWVLATLYVLTIVVTVQIHSFLIGLAVSLIKIFSVGTVIYIFFEHMEKFGTAILYGILLAIFGLFFAQILWAVF